jgi:hypothetical protein
MALDMPLARACGHRRSTQRSNAALAAWTWGIGNAPKTMPPTMIIMAKNEL